MMCQQSLVLDIVGQIHGQRIARLKDEKACVGDQRRRMSQSAAPMYFARQSLPKAKAAV